MDTLNITHASQVRLTAGQRQKIGEVARWTHLMGKKPSKAVNGETWYAFKRFNVEWRCFIEHNADGTSTVLVRDD